jgi:hypothetical protein
VIEQAYNYKAYIVRLSKYIIIRHMCRAVEQIYNYKAYVSCD